MADKLSQSMSARFPGLLTAGTFCPPFRDLTIEEERRMLQDVNATKPDIVWVGLGLLKQETWIAKYKDRLDVSWLIGVGTARWAPPWIRRIGIEWLYRLFFEPRMLVRNHRNAKFLFSAVFYETRHRIRGKQETAAK